MKSICITLNKSYLAVAVFVNLFYQLHNEPLIAVAAHGEEFFDLISTDSATAILIEHFEDLCHSFLALQLLMVDSSQQKLGEIDSAGAVDIYGLENAVDLFSGLFLAHKFRVTYHELVMG
jgi:hypothetical protein